MVQKRVGPGKRAETREKGSEQRGMRADRREEREERREKSAERSEKREDDWGSITLPLRERDPSMAEAAVQHGQPAVPVNGEYHRMEDHDFTKRFKNKTRLKIWGKVAWLERPLNKSRPKVALQLTEAGDDAVTIDWRPAVPEWTSGRLQLVLAEGVLGVLEDEQEFGKLHQE